MQGKNPWFFSVHGGHSKEFCDHADSPIEQMILRAIEIGMPVFGISEHAPRNHEKYLYPEEIELNRTPDSLIKTFHRYCDTIEHLQKKYAQQITLLKGLEIEVVPTDSYVEFSKKIIKEGNIEYIVGSVHWVNDIMTDFSKETFEEAIKTFNGLENLMVSYYQTLIDMVNNIKPDIVAHFDLITCFLKPDELPTPSPKITKIIEKALEAIKQNNCLLELNTSGLRKPIQRIFPDSIIIQQAKELSIPFTFGDDSHSVNQVGYGITQARQLLLNHSISHVIRLNKPNPEDRTVIREEIPLNNRLRKENHL
ncbi:MAG TPA: histidinol-phosphatase [Candidatus Hydrogenedens sp.]|nr:histidinol-phosphatase [Candidatus Hydrogenedens sp.]HOL20716.1 histidinol-phosphatase [Candidatus Hydrogenedens sp.]HPP58552.1 histidinol-phosphatase [Candidatus Hydrogenedens sp.]